MEDPRRQLNEIFGDIGPKAQELRVTLWPVVNWLIPLHLQPETESPDMFASRAQPLPAVPRAGEWVSLPGGRAPVEYVQWLEDGRILVRVSAQSVASSMLDRLKSAGWTVFPPQDADDWLANALD